jgi:hypothetical protein
MLRENIIPERKKFKVFIVKVVFWFLGRAFQAAAKHDSYVKDEIENWPEGSKLLLKTESNGPCLVMAKKDGKLKYAGGKECSAEFAVYFKNIEAALLVLTGRLGIADAYAQHRFGMEGDIMAYGMPFVRCIYIVEYYLFPKFMTRKILKRMPKRGTNSFIIYMGTLFGI